MFHGVPIGGGPAHEVVSRGIALVPEGRRLFPSLTVEENLLIGGQLGRTGPWNLKRVYELFPMLEERRNQPAPSLSGGQQQMVAIGRALMSNPTLLLCDEISLGLAPIVIRDIYARIPAIVAEGLSLVIVEQDIVQALKTARHVYCLQEGRVALQARRDTDAREISRRISGCEIAHHRSAYLRFTCGQTDAMEWLNTILQGVLLGGLYAMFAAGLSLIFGVMRLVNIAHGDLIVLAAYIALVTVQALGINPLLSLVIVVPVMAAIGYGAAARAAQPHARRRSAAAAAGDLRPLRHHPERAA